MRALSRLTLVLYVGCIFVNLGRPHPCSSQPCLNNGTCSYSQESSSTDQTYNCTCATGFTGRSCESFIDPCMSNPCIHGNCTSTGPDSYICDCNEGYQGERCEQILLSTPASPLRGQDTSTTEKPLPLDTTSLPDLQMAVTLPSWQPKLGQKVTELSFQGKEITLDFSCGNSSLTGSNDGRSLALEIMEETSVKIKANLTSPPALWSVNEDDFRQCSITSGKSVLLFDALDGMVLPDEALSLGNNYFIGFVKDSSQSVVMLHLNITVKVSNCVEPGSSFNGPECSGKGKCTTYTSKATFFCECDQKYTGIFCEEFDACHTKPCENNGTCTDVRQGKAEKNFTCACKPGYEGDQCQFVVNHCLPQPCMNGGTCLNTFSGYNCQCPEGYRGNMCEQKIDPCSSSPCQNNGSCYVDRMSFGCSCSPGYTGPTCAQLIDFCALNPCSHGICRSMGTSYKCLCVPGYHGLYCEEEYNECLSTPCQNSGTCKDLVNDYECLCTPEYEGKHCELYKDPCVNVTCQNGGKCESEGLNATCLCPLGFTGDDCEIDINECESNPCHHGGTCVDQPKSYICHCPQGWVGPNCEIHLQLKSSRTAETLSNMPRHSLYIIIGALCVAFVLMLIILIVGICRISRIEYQGSSRSAYEEFYNCRSIDSEFSNAIASIRHARFGKKSRPAMYDATPITYEDYSPDDKPLVTLIKTKDL
ncbi:delta and Notch-like epidermal growth factor-related receptor [Erpetoichthys calabaricus]|uniref:delta and Notch-like epidermal growth factor-related receptor n=1 Tax=Erpetoichthys calabaricus TaxID=27687 RepID=UPI0022347197|nr:delta and Notch-like epidermal growth factor-related receptor [Erpetoichthys calabaricus]